MSTASSTIRKAPPTLESIQRPVASRLEDVTEAIRRIVVSDFEMIEEVNEYLLLMRGKLFRPTLLLLANEVDDEAHEQAVTLGAVVELVHLATLVHDDAVDHSVLRRGMPTINALWTHQVAIILGDYLYSRAVTELASLGILEAVKILGRAANEMSVGEMRQLTSYDALGFSEQDYYRLISAKTASLMSAACEMGVLVGAPAQRGALARFGRNLGMAFQIADDLLDYTGSEAVIGKPSGHDLRERKVTLPLVSAMSKVDETEDRLIRRFFTLVDPSDQDISDVIEIVSERGGLSYARSRALEFAERAELTLEELPKSAAVDSLREAVLYAVDRSR